MRALLILLVCLCAQAQERKLKVHISVDMEGVAGVASADQLSPGSFEYERFRRFMTQEAVAAVEGAKAAGATHIVVADAHGNAQNLLIEMFPPDVKLVRSFPRRLGMMGGIDNTFDAAIFIGYHASTNNREGVRAHTFSSARLTRVAINGQEMTEGSWNAAIAGHFNVPVVFLSGDNAAIDEVRSLIGPLKLSKPRKLSASTPPLPKRLKLRQRRFARAFKKRCKTAPATNRIEWKARSHSKSASSTIALSKCSPTSKASNAPIRIASATASPT
jgi:D-aminopeptidase